MKAYNLIKQHKTPVGVTYLVSYSSRQNGFYYHSSCFSSNNAKSQSRSIVHQFNSLHMLPVNLKTKLLHEFEKIGKTKTFIIVEIFVTIILWLVSNNGVQT